MQTGNTIYLDYQASTPVDPKVAKIMSEQNDFANPHSTGHILGQRAAAKVEAARHQIEQCIHAMDDEIIFTSGATESNNQAIASVLFADNTLRNTILIGAIEHKCIKNSAYFFAQKLGYQVQEIPVLKTGRIDIEQYKALLSDKVLLVCVMAVNNEIGTIEDIRELARLAHERGAVFHCDAAQAPEAIDIDVKAWDVDMLSLSAHKIYGPKGVGALYIQNSLQARLPPLIQGGGQQSGMRSGTVSTPLVCGFAAALEISGDLAGRSRDKLSALKQRFIARLDGAKIVFHINGDQQNCHPGNLNIEFNGINNLALLQQLQPYICASTGSACNSDIAVVSHVLRAIGLTDEQAGSSIRFSLGRFSNEQQIDSACEILIKSIHKLQHAST